MPPTAASRRQEDFKKLAFCLRETCSANQLLTKGKYLNFLLFLVAIFSLYSIPDFPRSLRPDVPDVCHGADQNTSPQYSRLKLKVSLKTALIQYLPRVLNKILFFFFYHCFAN